MVDFDMTWNNPTYAQIAALKIVSRQKPRGLTTFQAAEFMCMADSSLFYVQVKTWSLDPPDLGEGTSLFQDSCKLVVEIIDNGYNPETNTWWRVSGSPAEQAKKLISLAGFGLVLQNIKRSSNLTISSSFETFLEILLGRDWEQRFKDLRKKVRKSKSG